MAEKTDKDKLITCVRCTYTTKETDEFCIRCGAPLHNRCTDEPGLLDKGCKFVNKPEAAYCAKCGHPTVFLRTGLVRDPYA